LAQLASLESISFVYTPVGDGVLAHLGKLTQLTDLGFHNAYEHAAEGEEVPEITDEGLKSLRVLASLRNLCLHTNAITDDGLKSLGGLKNLRSLRLRAEGLTDAGLEHLADLTNLETLVFRQTQVGVAGLASLSPHLPNTKISTDRHEFHHATGELKLTGGTGDDLALALEQACGLTELRVLKIIRMYDITDADLAHLAKLGQLETLTMRDSRRITDAGLEHLKGLTELRVLKLSLGSNITDAGLVPLRKLTRLERLELRDINVTPRGVSDLRSAMPGCEIKLQ
jgi:F-box/leucine-rich repeat protein 14